MLHGALELPWGAMASGAAKLQKTTCICPSWGAAEALPWNRRQPGLIPARVRRHKGGSQREELGAGYTI